MIPSRDLRFSTQTSVQVLKFCEHFRCIPQPANGRVVQARLCWDQSCDLINQFQALYITTGVLQNVGMRAGQLRFFNQITDSILKRLKYQRLLRPQEERDNGAFVSLHRERAPLRQFTRSG